MKAKITKDDDGYWLQLDGDNQALIVLDGRNPIVNSALEEAIEHEKLKYSEPFDYNAFGINTEPEHNTESVLCWCAPVMDDGVIIHRSIGEIIRGEL